jgi:four helix bundle protein
MRKQLLRSGSSVGANIRKEQNAQSNMDFIHKLYIAQKECDETKYWLELLHQADFLSEEEFISISTDATSILKMLRSAILTTNQNLKNNNL